MSALPRDAEAERIKRTLSPTGRRLVRRADGRWCVIAGDDRRRRPVLVAAEAIVLALVADGALLRMSGDVMVLAPGAAPPPSDQPTPPPWVFAAQGARRPGERVGGHGFVGLAMLSREEGGPLTLRQTQAGLRLIADAERAAADARLTMNWDAGPKTRTRMSGSSGGRVGDALVAGRQLRRLRAVMGEEAWRLAWALCVDGETLRSISRRRALTHRKLKPKIRQTLDDLANAYDGQAPAAWARMR